jgi:hypothetical protein
VNGVHGLLARPTNAKSLEWKNGIVSSWVTPLTEALNVLTYYKANNVKPFHVKDNLKEVITWRAGNKNNGNNKRHLTIKEMKMFYKVNKRNNKSNQTEDVRNTKTRN